MNVNVIPGATLPEFGETPEVARPERRAQRERRGPVVRDDERLVRRRHIAAVRKAKGDGVVREARRARRGGLSHPWRPKRQLRRGFRRPRRRPQWSRRLRSRRRQCRCCSPSRSTRVGGVFLALPLSSLGGRETTSLAGACFGVVAYRDVPVVPGSGKRRRGRRHRRAPSGRQPRRLNTRQDKRKRNAAKSTLTTNHASSPWRRVVNAQRAIGHRKRATGCSRNGSRKRVRSFRLTFGARVRQWLNIMQSYANECRRRRPARSQRPSRRLRH